VHACSSAGGSTRAVSQTEVGRAPFGRSASSKANFSRRISVCQKQGRKHITVSLLRCTPQRCVENQPENGHASTFLLYFDRSYNFLLYLSYERATPGMTPPPNGRLFASYDPRISQVHGHTHTKLRPPRVVFVIGCVSCNKNSLTSGKNFSPRVSEHRS
jgi:hypothetical protein